MQWDLVFDQFSCLIFWPREPSAFRGTMAAKLDDMIRQSSMPAHPKQHRLVPKDNCSKKTSTTPARSRRAGGKSEQGKGGKKSKSQAKRPMNSFMLWAKHARPVLASKYDSLPNYQISTLLGIEWKKVPEADRQIFKDEAARLMKQHKEKHPKYDWHPTRSEVEQVPKPASLPKSTNHSPASSSEVCCFAPPPFPSFQSVSDVCQVADCAEGPEPSLWDPFPQEARIQEPLLLSTQVPYDSRLSSRQVTASLSDAFFSTFLPE